MRTITSTRRLVGATMLTVLLLGSSAPAGADQHLETIVDGGLIGPLGLAVDDAGAYVAQAFSGQISHVSIDDGVVTTIHDSRGRFTPGVAVGPQRGKHGPEVVFTSALFRGDRHLQSFLSRVGPSVRSAPPIASLSQHERRTNPDADQEYGFIGATDECLAALPPFFQPYRGILDSNPYAVAIDTDGSYLVADAAGNSIVRVDPRTGHTTTVAVLAPVPQVLDADTAEMVEEDLLLYEGIEVDLSPCVGQVYTGEPVPTDVEVGPDGHYYVTTLPGFPEAAGAASVLRIDRTSGDITEVVSGLTGAVDLAFDGDGAIWVAELFAFQVTKIVGGAVVDGFFAHSPGAIEAGPDGWMYVTTGVFDEEVGGSLLRFQP